jgi:hypothetical protein
VIFQDNFSLFNLFLDKNVNLYIDNKTIKVRVPTIRELQLNDNINATYHIMTASGEKLKKMSAGVDIKDSLDYVKMLVFQFGAFKEYSKLVSNLRSGLCFFLPGFKTNFQTKELIVGDITITQEI